MRSPPSAARSNCSRVQKLSSAFFSGFWISRSGTKPTASLSACTAVLRTSGSTTTRSDRRVLEQVRHHGGDDGPGEAVHGRVGGRDQEVHADVAGLGSYSPTSSTCARVVALHEEGGLAVVQPEQRVVVLVGRDLHVGALDVLAAARPASSRTPPWGG